MELKREPDSRGPNPAMTAERAGFIQAGRPKAGGELRGSNSMLA